VLEDPRVRLLVADDGRVDDQVEVRPQPGGFEAALGRAVGVAHDDERQPSVAHARERFRNLRHHGSPEHARPPVRTKDRPQLRHEVVQA
jgi:hypothetical protein